MNIKEAMHRKGTFELHELLVIILGGGMLGYAICDILGHITK